MTWVAKARIVARAKAVAKSRSSIRRVPDDWRFASHQATVNRKGDEPERMETSGKYIRREAAGGKPVVKIHWLCRLQRDCECPIWDFISISDAVRI